MPREFNIRSKNENITLGTRKGAIYNIRESSRFNRTTACAGLRLRHLSQRKGQMNHLNR